MMNGILNLYKSSGMTSHDAVAICRRLFGVRRIGHSGTLDPMATGVLPILIGSACSAQEYLTEHDKSYTAGIRFGIMTDTGDITGNVISESDVIPTSEEVEKGVLSFIGEYDQIPPMYSALKIDGKKLCDLARNGVTVERKPRRIKIYFAEILEKVNESDYSVSFSVSKGTYIRTLAEDIGNAISGSPGACLYSLERTRCGDLFAKDAVTIDRLKEIVSESGVSAVEKLLLPCEAAFSALPTVTLSEFYTRLCKNGLEIYLSRADIPQTSFSPDGKCRLYGNDGVFFALGEKRLYPDGEAVKAVVRFDTLRKDK